MFSLSKCPVSAAIAVSDIERARRFYERVLGLALDRDSGDNVAYRCADGSVLHVFVSPNAGTSRATMAGWSVDDIDVAVAALGAQGVRFELYTTGPIITDGRGVASFPGGNKVAYFKDPDGNVLSIAYAPQSQGGEVGDDRQAVGSLLDAWWQATRAHDVDAILPLMADDVLFLTPSQEPFGKAAFAAAARAMSAQIDGSSEIEELEITDGWAWMRTHIMVTMTGETGEVHHRSGHTLTVLRKDPKGRWVIARDANLLSP